MATYDIVILSILIVLLVGVVFWIIWDYMRWKKIKVVVKELTNSRKQVREFKAREIIDDSKVSWWLLKGERDKIKRLMPIPPSESIDLTHKGKKFHECYRTEQGEYIPIIDDNRISEVPKEYFDNLNKEKEDYIAKHGEVGWHQYKNECLKTYMVRNNIVCPIKPVTKEQRMSLVNNIKKAESRNVKDWKQNLPVYVSLGIFVILFALIMLFAPDLIKILQKGSTDVIAQWDTSIKSYEKIRHDNLMEEMKEWEKVHSGMQVITSELVRVNDRLKYMDDRIAAINQSKGQQNP